MAKDKDAKVAPAALKRVAVYRMNPVMATDAATGELKAKEPVEHGLFGHFEFAEGVDSSVVRDCLARGDFNFKPA